MRETFTVDATSVSDSLDIAFTQRSFYTEKSLDRGAFTDRRLYTQKLLRREPLPQRIFVMLENRIFT